MLIWTHTHRSLWADVVLWPPLVSVSKAKCEKHSAIHMIGSRETVDIRQANQTENQNEERERERERERATEKEADRYTVRLALPPPLIWFNLLYSVLVYKDTKYVTKIHTCQTRNAINEEIIRPVRIRSFTATIFCARAQSMCAGVCPVILKCTRVRKHHAHTLMFSHNYFLSPYSLSFSRSRTRKPTEGTTIVEIYFVCIYACVCLKRFGGTAAAIGCRKGQNGT